MTTKKPNSEKTSPIKRLICYILSSVLILGTVYFGSKNKTAEENGVPIMLAISDNNYSVSVDQISELYIVAEAANNLSLGSSNYLNMDYISAVTQYSINQTASTKIEKTNIVDTSSLAKGVIEYEVGAGESMDNIAASFGLSTDQIRWSNGMKNTDVSQDQTLFLPSVSGIVYTVKFLDLDTFKLLGSFHNNFLCVHNSRNGTIERNIKIIFIKHFCLLTTAPRRRKYKTRNHRNQSFPLSEIIIT